MLSQEVRFFRSFDGTEIAYAVSGHGPPLVMLPSWLTHLEAQWRTTAWRPWLEVLSASHRLIRYDPRGCGMSSRRVTDLSFESWVRDFGALVDMLGLARFAVLGICQGGAIAIDYAGRHPERVSHLVLHGAYARGRNRRDTVPLEPEKAKLMLEMVRLGWAQEDHAFMRAFATQFQPEGSIEHLRSWCELQRAAVEPEAAARLTEIMFDVDVSASAARIACPTLVMHPARDAVVPLDEGRLLAQTIPAARFVQLDSPNHFLLPEEPAWQVLRQALRDFLPSTPPMAIEALTARERELLELLARGMDNLQIAAQLGIAEKTVRNHVSNVFAKLGADTRARAIVMAREAGYGRGERPS